MRPSGARVRVVVGGVASVLLIGSFGSTANAFTDRDCDDFDSRRQAQKFIIKHGGPDKDRHRLDADNDGKACEDTDY